MPRDRDGGFEPELVKKGQTRIDGIVDKSEPASRHRLPVAELSRGASRFLAG